MASVNSPIRNFLKPILFKLLGKQGYFYAQYFAKLKDIRNRLVEEKEMVLLPSLVREGDEVLDIGANFAYYTVRLANLVGPKGKVFAFEPIPFTHAICKKILNRHKLNNTELFELGVGAKDETLRFRVPTVSFGAVSAGMAHMGSRNNQLEERNENYQFDSYEEFDCKVVQLDQILSEKLKKLSFVKMDIEGAEYFALQGMKNIISKFRPTILIEIQPYFLKGFSIDIDEFMTFLKSELGYQVFYYDENRKGLLPLTGLPWNNNYIIVHQTKIESIESLLAA